MSVLGQGDCDGGCTGESAFPARGEGESEGEEGEEKDFRYQTLDVRRVVECFERITGVINC